MRSTACRRVAECMRRAATAPRPLAPDRAPTHRALSIRAIATTTEAAEPSNTPTTSPGPAPAKNGRLPAFDYTALVASVCEVRALATPTKVEIAAQADAYTLVLGLRGIDGNVALHVSWHPDAARVCLGPPAPRIHKTEQLSFGEQCNALLRNLVLTRASMPEPWERIASFSFADRPGDAAKFTLHCEVMGRNSNAVLVDESSGKMVACAYQVGAAQTSVRPMSPGFEYHPPPPAPGIPPESTPTESEWRDVVTKATQLAADAQAERNKGGKGGKGGTKRTPGVEKGMVRAFRGVSPALASTLLSGAGPETSTLGPDPPASALDDDAWRALHAEWRRWVDAATRAVNAVGSDDDDDVAPVLDRSGWCENRGQLLLHEPTDPSAAGHAPLSAASRAADPAGAGGPIGALFARVYGGAGDADVFRREKDRLLQAISAAVKKARTPSQCMILRLAKPGMYQSTRSREDRWPPPRRCTKRRGNSDAPRRRWNPCSRRRRVRRSTSSRLSFRFGN